MTGVLSSMCGSSRRDRASWNRANRSRMLSWSTYVQHAALVSLPLSQAGQVDRGPTWISWHSVTLGVLVQLILVWLQLANGRAQRPPPVSLCTLYTVLCCAVLCCAVLYSQRARPASNSGVASLRTDRWLSHCDKRSAVWCGVGITLLWGRWSRLGLVRSRR